MDHTPNPQQNRRTALVRFVLPSINPDTGVQEGIFGAAHALRRKGEMAQRDREELGALLH